MNEIEELSARHDWNMPVACPVCGAPLEISPNHMHLACTNEFCPSRASGTIAKWCSVHGIRELGLTTIEKIQERGFFSSIGTMYAELDTPSSECRTVMSSELGKNWINIVGEIDSHRETTLAKFVAGYNIAGIGEKQVQKVIDFYSIKEFGDFFWSDSSQRFVCDGIGPVLSQKLSKGLEVNRADMEETIKHINIIDQITTTTALLAGMSFCFTGKCDAIGNRSICEKLVIENGGIISSVKKGLTYLVTDDINSGSNKNKKAKELGIKTITSFAFKKMLNK